MSSSSFLDVALYTAGEEEKGCTHIRQQSCYIERQDPLSHRSPSDLDEDDMIRTYIKVRLSLRAESSAEECLVSATGAMMIKSASAVELLR